MALKKNLVQREQDKFAQTTSDETVVRVLAINSLVPDSYDYISLGYTGTNLTTVIYKTGGSGGTTVATLTLGYSGSTLTSVTKT